MSLTKSNHADTVTTDTLVKDLRTLAGDAEELVRVTSANLTGKSKETAAAALDKLKTTCKTVERKSVDGAQAADELIRENPYWSAGAAFGIGLLIGVLATLGSSKRSD